MNKMKTHCAINLPVQLVEHIVYNASIGCSSLCTGTVYFYTLKYCNPVTSTILSLFKNIISEYEFHTFIMSTLTFLYYLGTSHNLLTGQGGSGVESGGGEGAENILSFKEWNLKIF